MKFEVADETLIAGERRVFPGWTLETPRKKKEKRKKKRKRNHAHLHSLPPYLLLSAAGVHDKGRERKRKGRGEEKESLC